MQTNLQFNICGLESSYLANTQIIDLDYRLNNKIGLVLSYGCNHWATHVVNVGSTSLIEPWTSQESLTHGVERTITSYLLYWLEVLGLQKNLSTAITQLKQLLQWPLVSNACFINSCDSIKTMCS